ncbi:MAG: ATP-binding protein [Geobacteraceae bacterium]|nr:ATP-binding protein [Geobacteraceae bacterium]
MTPPTYKSPTRIISWLAGIVLGIMVIIFPGGYFLISYNYTVGNLETEAEIISWIVSQIISSNPDMWQFEKVRIEEYLSRRPRKGYPETRRVLNRNNELIGQSSDTLPAPVLSRSARLFDSGNVVGRLEVSRSLRPILTRTLVLGLIMMPLGVGVFMVLRIIPIHLIRKRIENALNKERDTAQRYLDIAGVMLVAIDAGNMVTMINRKGCEVLGCPERDILRNNWFDSFVPEKNRGEARDLLKHLARQNPGQHTRLESPVLTSFGDERVIEWHHIPLTDALGQFAGILSSGEDITERRNLEAQLRHSQKMDAIGQFAGGVAHDFNNIITVIIGYCSVMQMQMAEEDPQRQNIKQVLAAADRAANLTRSLLLLSRKESINPRKADLNEIVTNVGKFISRIIGEDIRLKTALCKAPLEVCVDSGQIEQILMNLSTNSRDAMEKGGTLAIETSLYQITNTFVQAHGYGSPGKYALLTVSDSGKGMVEKTRKRIFEPFFTTKEIGKGTGLGLSIVYGIVKQHSGFINVYSEIGEGTTFKVYLPIISGKNEEGHEIPVLELAKTGTETILVAEDDTSVRTLVESILKEFGYKVLLANDGQHAVQVFSTNKKSIQLVLMDIIMPRKSGREAFKEIREMEPGIKVLFMSGYTTEIIRNRGEFEKSVELIAKPVQPLELLGRIRETLDRA